jgi:two-component system, cell cycle sensor histidine kinase and response regulator CckA
MASVLEAVAGADWTPREGVPGAHDEDWAPDDAVTSGGVAWRRDRIRLGAAAASIATAAVGASVLAGWWFGNPVLKSGLPGRVAMNPVTAVAFLAAGLALWLLRMEAPSRPRRVVAHLCAASVVLLALLCLSRLYTPWDLGLDRLLFPQRVIEAADGLPNRMAPNTGLNFLLLGFALLLLDYRTRRGWWPAHALATIVGVSALGAVLGYAYGSRLLYGVGAFIPMALNTALTFLLLAAGVLCARPTHGLPSLWSRSGPGGVLVRRLLPAASVIPLALGWLALRGHAAGLYDPAGGVAVLMAATTLIIGALVWLSAVALNQSDVTRARAELRIREANEELEARVVERTAELERVNHVLRSQVQQRIRAEQALRRTTAELRASVGELRALVEASPLAICTLTPDGCVRSWNRAAEELFGWTADEVIGAFLPNVPADMLGEHERLRERVLAGNPFTEFETRRVRKDGRLLDVSVSTAALYDAEGAACGLVAVYADVGERKTLEGQLRQSQKMEAIGRLAGGVAHDFNNILTVIRAAAEFMLVDLEADDARRTDAADIRDAADRAAGLTRQLLAFSRQQVLHLRTVDFNGVVTAIEPMVRRLVEENIAVATRLAPALDPIRADANQLEQVILNLVVNARDAMTDGGTLLIETSNVVLDEEYPRTHATAQAGPHVVLTVTDTGCGMDAATQARIFEPFFTTKPIGQGTGLGLATVYGIVKQSGGHIWVYSEVGRGTSFKIYFPRCTGPGPEEEEEAKAQGRQTGREDDTSGATILLVEDDVTVRVAVRRVLERRGYRVLEAPNAGEALAAAAKPDEVIDLVISDMVMPGMSGLELRQRLRALRPALGVLLMSGYSEEAITRLGSPEPTGPLIEKPFTVQGILDKVQEMLTTEQRHA